MKVNSLLSLPRAQIILFFSLFRIIRTGRILESAITGLCPLLFNRREATASQNNFLELPNGLNFMHWLSTFQMHSKSLDKRLFYSSFFRLRSEPSKMIWRQHKQVNPSQVLQRLNSREVRSKHKRIHKLTN